MYAMKYASLPIVRSTGGLSDTVREFIPSEKTGNGFVFWNYNADDLKFAINRALLVYNSDGMNLARKNAINEDFSSTQSAAKYIKCFHWALEKI
jgi:starch synthase